MPSYDLRNTARGLVDGSYQEMEFSSCLHHEYRRECWVMDWWLKILSLRASHSFQQVNEKKTFQGMR